MTAFDLIDSIFARPAWRGQPGNIRSVTAAQLSYLRNLIDADPEGGAVTKGAGNSIVWMPAGRHKYILTEDVAGTKHTLTRLSNIVASGTGFLF